MFDFLDVQGSAPCGLTMVLDKGLGLHALDDLLSVAGPYVQIIKFGWGTTKLLDPGFVRTKIERIRQRGIQVCPGGTFLEIAFARGRSAAFLNDARELGFSSVEVSNGVVDMDEKAKLELIRRAREAGFTVFSEVGRKAAGEDRLLEASVRAEFITRELAAGASKVIVEARESGSLGIFDSAGRVREPYLDDLIRGLDVDSILFEAPRKNQQVWLIRRFGPAVHLGNVLPEDALSVQTLRTGLRGDTCRDFLL